MGIKCKGRPDIPVSYSNHLYGVSNSLVKYAQSYIPPKFNGTSIYSVRLTIKKPKSCLISKK